MSESTAFGEAALHALIEQAPDAIFVADLDGRYIYVNDAACRILGYSRDELLRQRIQDSVAATEAGRLARARASMLEGRTRAAEWTLRRKDGSLLPVEVNANILPGGQWQGFVRDISQRKALEAERQALFDQVAADQRQLQTLVDTLPLGVVLFGPDGTVRANPRTEELLGMKFASAGDAAQYAGRICYPDGRPVPPQQLLAARLLRGESVLAEEFLVRRPDGTELPVLASAAPIVDGEERRLGGVAVFQDITALHDAQEKLRASEELFRTVFDLLPVGLWIADRHGRVMRGNPAGHRIWQGAGAMGPEHYGQQQGWRVDTGKLLARDEWGIPRAIRQGETSPRDLIRIQCFDGSFKTVINWAGPIRSDSGEITGAVAVNEDVTALHQTQEQLRAAVRDREEILALVTHDLRSPLGAITTLAAMVALKAQQLEGGEPVRAMADNLTEIARQMAGLVNDLLAVAVVRHGGTVLKLVPTRATALLEKATRAARPMFARRGVGLQVQLPAELPVVHVDADRILRVFSNLLDNALKFTAPPGEVELRAEALSSGVRYCVSNSGPPLSAGELQNMFQPFWQAGRGDGRGAGLGLSICRSIIEAHGGSIWAEPAAGKRVRVCFLLPWVPAAFTPPA